MFSVAAGAVIASRPNSEQTRLLHDNARRLYALDQRAADTY